MTMDISDWTLPYRAHFPSREWQAEVQDRIKRSHAELLRCTQAIMVANAYEFNEVHTALEHAIECERYACYMRKQLSKAAAYNIEPIDVVKDW